VRLVQRCFFASCDAPATCRIGYLAKLWVCESCAGKEPEVIRVLRLRHREGDAIRST